MSFAELVASLDAQPYGFDDCARQTPSGERTDRCPHWRPQSDRVCGPCVLHHIDQVPAESCQVCCKPLPSPGLCSNWLCQEHDPRWLV